MSHVEYRRATAADAESLARPMTEESVFAGLPQLPRATAAAWQKRLVPQVATAESIGTAEILACGNAVGLDQR